ncbi:MAG: DUF3341 domain-containing protein [Balneolales bacterium]
MSQNKSNIYGILAEYKNPAELMNAASKVAEAGYTKFDAYSPFPIHGMDKAMKLKESKLGWVVMAHAVFGLLFGLGLQILTQSMLYAHNVSGKPFANIPAFIPVTFELTILFSAFGAFFGMFYLNNLPKLHKSLFNSDHFAKATDDGFFICIESDDDLFADEKTEELLKSAGATYIEKIEP